MERICLQLLCMILPALMPMTTMKEDLRSKWKMTVGRIMAYFTYHAGGNMAKSE
jgi:hypothetical protein